MAGDLNMGNISWSKGSGFVSSNRSFGKRFVENLDDCFLSQCVKKTTFRKGLDDHIGSLLDLVITDSKKRVFDMKNQVALDSLSRFHSVLK